MRRFAIGFAAVLVAGTLVGDANAQVSGSVHRQRVRLAQGYYNGYGYQPGLSYYPGTGMFSQDYAGGHKYFHQGYTPPRSGRYGHPALRYNGVYGAPNNWMFYYPGMELSPYNVNSPIWGW